MIRPLFVAAVMLTPLSAIAEESLDQRITPDVLAAFDKAEFEHEGFTLPFRLATPEEVEGEKRPLLLFLHGYGERGSENQRQLIHGGRLFASPEFQARYRAYVLAPQCPDGVEPGGEEQRVWTRLVRTESPTLSEEEALTPQLAAARALVEHLIATQPVDPDRIYVGGLSMGGYATWTLITQDPSRWAAALPICGAGDPSQAARIARIPLWDFHGDEDGAIPVERSREMIAALEAAGGRPIYTEYPGVGHDSWTPTFASRHVWDWLFAQRR
ncbi:carboxylesterase family protein [Botrimarina hoheduenensis]|uniref:Esterase n=1 Tax=Botrimarina hoheduenensis TaxID=2528000 RepID=A0A5C5W7P2_9BACT|nr:prolyl oligopeptidase family serine peptidase [Botrimarina hoheduenensis]TWT46908.1 esterase [Botrimarina hoheduenensis]